MKIPLTTRLSGVTFGDAQANIKKFGCEDIGSYALIREPENPHDPNAIRVSLFDQYFMGYIPKHIAKDLAPLMDAGGHYIAEYVYINGCSFNDTMGLTIRVSEID